MLDRKKKERIQKLMERAYALGFEVGYYKHYESVGWVKRELRRIEEEAKKLGIWEKILEIYRRGRADGERKRAMFLIEGEARAETSGGRGRVRGIEEEERRTPIARVIIRWKAHRRPPMIRLPSFLRRRNQF
ncbi:MAG: hypothetical protein J7J42_05350 [Thermoplasmata archaeon]|nr:hypothetical protein [Thermoplasmata archaeon]